MKDLTQILEYYPKLKEKINKDTPQIYEKVTTTQYVKNNKLNPNIGLIYDFGGTEDPVKGKNVVIVDYDPDEDTSNISSINDKDLTIYKYEAKDPNVKLPNTLEVKGKLFIAYANILNFPKVLKAKSFKIFNCEMKDNLFNSKLLIDGDLDILSVSYNGTNIMDDLKTPEVDTMDKLIDKIRNLIENNGGYVNGDIKVNNVRF
jgi:hypothetical protein